MRGLLSVPGSWPFGQAPAFLIESASRPLKNGPGEPDSEHSSLAFCKNTA